MALGAEFFAEEADEFAATWCRDEAPLEKGGVGEVDGLAGGFGVDGGELRDDFASDGGAYGEGAVGLGGYAELSEEGFDFLLEGHGCGHLWFVASVEGAGGGWQTDGYPPMGDFCVKSSKERL